MVSGFKGGGVVSGFEGGGRGETVLKAEVVLMGDWTSIAGGGCICACCSREWKVKLTDIDLAALDSNRCYSTLLFAATAAIYLFLQKNSTPRTKIRKQNRKRN